MCRFAGRRTGALRLARDHDVGEPVERDLGVERAYLPAGSVPLARTVVAVIRGRPADVDGVRVPRLEGVREPPISPLSPLMPGGPRNPRGPRAPRGLSGRVPASTISRRTTFVTVFWRRSERRRTEQGDDERCGGECDGEALQGALKLAPCRGCCLPDREGHADRCLDLLPPRLDRSVGAARRARRVVRLRLVGRSR